MLRNSFKFLSLALAASLTITPLSAIDLNPNLRQDLIDAGQALGIYIVGGAVFYLMLKTCEARNQYFAQKNAEQKKITPAMQVAGNSRTFREKLHDYFSIFNLFLQNVKTDLKINSTTN